VVDQVVALLTKRLERSGRTHRLPSPPPAMPKSKGTVLQRLRALQAEGLSLQKIADRFNTEGVPTLSGKGVWEKGTISDLLKE
jgi:Recombinase